MRLLLQRVRFASVTVAGETVSRIGPGVLVLVGVEKGDTELAARRAAEKLIGLRLFDDSRGRMNLDTAQAGGEFLVVSQFTLAGSLKKGRRPSFDGAARPEEAAPLVERIAKLLEEAGLSVGRGRFGAHMEVSLVNDGPVTFVLEIAAE